MWESVLGGTLFVEGLLALAAATILSLIITRDTRKILISLFPNYVLMGSIGMETTMPFLALTGTISTLTAIKNNPITNTLTQTTSSIISSTISASKNLGSAYLRGRRPDIFAGEYKSIWKNMAINYGKARYQKAKYGEKQEDDIFSTLEKTKPTPEKHRNIIAMMEYMAAQPEKLMNNQARWIYETARKIAETSKEEDIIKKATRIAKRIKQELDKRIRKMD